MKKSKTIFLTLLLNLAFGANAKEVKPLIEELDESFDKSKGKVEFIPVKLSKIDKNKNFKFDSLKDSNQGVNGKDHFLSFKNKNYLTINDSQKVTLEAIEFKKVLNKDLKIEFTVSDKKYQELEKLSQRYKNHKLAVIVDGEVVMMPSLKKVAMGNGFELLSHDPVEFKNTFNNLKTHTKPLKAF